MLQRVGTTGFGGGSGFGGMYGSGFGGLYGSGFGAYSLGFGFGLLRMQLKLRTNGLESNEYNRNSER